MSEELLRALLEQMREESNRRFSALEKAIERLCQSMERTASLEQITQNQSYLIASQSDSIIGLTERINRLEGETGTLVYRKTNSDKLVIGIALAAAAAVVTFAFKLLGSIF